MGGKGQLIALPTTGPNMQCGLSYGKQTKCTERYGTAA